MKNEIMTALSRWFMIEIVLVICGLLCGIRFWDWNTTLGVACNCITGLIVIAGAMVIVWNEKIRPLTDELLDLI